MPLYRYKCKSCDHEQAELAELDDDPPECAECGGQTRMVIGRTAFVLQGGGWFEGGYGGASE